MPEKISFVTKEYGLGKGIPFKERIASDLQLKAWVNRDKEIERWNKIIENAVNSKNINFLSFVIGDYGMGKTLALLKVLEAAKLNNKLYAIYLNLISEQKPKNPGLDVLQRIFKEIDLSRLKVKVKDVALLKKTLPEIGIVLEKIIFGKDTEEKFLLTSFLCGEIKPSQAQLKKIGIIRKIENVEIAKEYLIGILYLLKMSGYFTLILSLDEFEYLFSLVTKSSQAIYLALLRGLFDLPADPRISAEIKNNMANMVFFIATSEDGWRRLKDLEEKETSIGGPIVPLMRRVTDKINLKALSKNDTEKLIEKRLSLDRIKGRYQAEPLIPFNMEFVNYIFK